MERKGEELVNVYFMQFDLILHIYFLSASVALTAGSYGTIDITS